jgi:multisubunit Na+/H+ antiporter MnhC subunit
LPRGNVLPDSVRKFTVKLDKVGAFGKYTLVGNFGYGNDGQLLSGSTTFYVVPLAAIIIVAAIVILIVFLIFALPKLIRGYNRKIVQRATRR